MEVDDDYDEDIDEIEVEAYTTDTYGNVITKREMAYDSMGRVTETRDCLPGWCSQTAADVYRTYSYNYASVMNAEKYSSVLGATAPNVGLSYSYNVAGQLTGVSGGQNNAPLTPSIWSATAIGPSGPTLAQFGNGLYGLNSYDSAGRVNSGSVCQGSSQFGCANGTTVYSFTDTVVGRQLNHSGDTVLGQQRDYTYDEFGRLQGFTTTANSGPAVGMNFGYDRYGNRMAQTMTAGSGPQPSFGFNSANNQVTGFSYDIAGNVIYDGQHSYTYDDENNLVQVDGGSTAIYQFDAFNQRVSENTSAGGLVLYGFDLNGRRSTAWSGGGELLQVQYYGQNGRLAYWSSTDSSIHFEHQDWLGTERLRTTATGAQDGAFSSLPFGDGASTSGSDTDAGHFATLDQNAGSQTSHAFYRDYNSLTGSWLSPDSYSGSYSSSSPQSFNRYNYTKNRPLIFIDPSGQDEGGGLGDGTDSGEGGDPCEGNFVTCVNGDPFLYDLPAQAPSQPSQTRPPSTPPAPSNPALKSAPPQICPALVMGNFLSNWSPSVHTAANGVGSAFSKAIFGGFAKATIGLAMGQQWPLAGAAAIATVGSAAYNAGQTVPALVSGTFAAVNQAHVDARACGAGG